MARKRKKSKDGEAEVSQEGGADDGGKTVVSTDAQNEEMLKKRGAGEAKWRKFWVRFVVGWLLIFFFFGIIFSGHLYVGLLIIGIQCQTFAELIRVRYEQKNAKEVPLYRTLQWLLFLVSMFFTYGEGLISFFGKYSRPDDKLTMLLVHYHGWICFSAYSILFVVAVLTMRKGYYRYQMQQLTWTLVVISMVVGQLKHITNLLCLGLFWVLLPASLVVCNDTWAYISGFAFGRKFFGPFLKLSPNKTWEGFIGGMICTCVFGVFWPLLLSQSQWLICPATELSIWPEALECTPHAVFQWTSYEIPEVLVSLLGRTQIDLLPVQIHCFFLALYASLVAPFGGFFASAIKRVYKLKDFDSYLPGHGGMMDRMDCQLLIMLCTAVHVNTFVKSVEVTVPVVLAQIAQLHTNEQQEVLTYLKSMLTQN